MKLKYILPVLLLGCSSLTYAQKKFPKEHSFGVTGGMTLSKMTFRPRVVQDFLPGATFGVTYRYIEEKYFGIQAELHFTQKGWKDRLEEYPQLHYERKLNYMELPVMTHIFFGNNRVRGFVNAGPQICYLLASKIDKNVFGEIDEETAHHDIPVKNRFDYGIVGGSGMEFR